MMQISQFRQMIWKTSSLKNSLRQKTCFRTVREKNSIKVILSDFVSYRHSKYMKKSVNLIQRHVVLNKICWSISRVIKNYESWFNTSMIQHSIHSFIFVFIHNFQCLRHLQDNLLYLFLSTSYATSKACWNHVLLAFNERQLQTVYKIYPDQWRFGIS